MAAAALVVAAGSSTRMGADKLWADVAGVPVLVHCLRALATARSLDAIVVVTREETLSRVRAACATLDKSSRVCLGGDRRQDSVRAGLELIDAEIVVVHDGARPLVDPAIVDEGVRLAIKHGAAIAAVPCIDTIKRVDTGQWVAETLERSQLWAVQTPQVFRTALLRSAHASITVDVTDDAAMLEQLGHPVRVYAGSRRNIKITSPEDLLIAELLLRG